jgi:cytochrome c oxidase subunit 2
LALRPWIVVLIALAGCLQADAPRAELAVREIDVVASQFRFEPATIDVAEGERVVLNIHSTDSTHGFAAKGLKVKATIPNGGQVVKVELSGLKPGTYEFHCNEYCGTGHLQMKGTLVVSPRK